MKIGVATSLSSGFLAIYLVIKGYGVWAFSFSGFAE